MCLEAVVSTPSMCLQNPKRLGSPSLEFCEQVPRLPHKTKVDVAKCHACHRPSVCVAGVALMARGWIWWRAWGPLAAGLRGRRGTWRRRPSFCVAGVEKFCANHSGMFYRSLVEASASHA